MNRSPTISIAGLLFALFVLEITACQRRNNTDAPLFKIVDDGKTGFININGDIIIEPEFRSAGELSEGLIPARKDGLYGYIDAHGEYIINPQFDYALPFRDSLASVYKDGKPFFIAHNGEILFDHSFQYLGNFKNGLAIAVTASKKCGVINKKGQLIIDTAFKSLSEFGNGLYIAIGLNDDKEIPGTTHNIREHGVINNLGSFIIPYGRYVHFELEKNGLLEGREIWPSETSIYLDSNGTIIRKTVDSKKLTILGGEGSGLIPIGIKKNGSYVEYYYGYMDTNGRTVFLDSLADDINSFYNDRAFIKYKNNDDDLFSVIDLNMTVLANKKFNDVLGEGFRDGYAFVKVNDKWGLVDRALNYAFTPKFEHITQEGLIENEYCFFYTDDNSYRPRYGIARKNGSIILEAVMEEYDRRGFQNGLVACKIEDRLSYVNKEGEIVWQEKRTRKKLANINIDYMNRAYFTAHSKPHPSDLGGNAETDNHQQKITVAKDIPTGALTLIVRPDKKIPFNELWNGIEVQLANTTNKRILFNAQDSRLNMKVQAMTADGWKDIEYLASSWCGNSYHVVTLEPEHSWKFITPVYEGAIRTKLRIELQYIDPSYKGTEMYNAPQLTVYSNEYEGSINPAQLWRKEGYTPSGLMDPYLE